MTLLRESLARRDVSKTDKYLLIIAMHDGPMKANDIRAVARQNGWKDGSGSLPGNFLRQTKNAIYLPNGWTVTEACKKSLADRGLLNPAGVLTPVTHALERYLTDVHDPDRARFIEEAIQCVKNKAYRSAIVLIWVGAVYLLYQHVLNNKLAEFNQEGRRRSEKNQKNEKIQKKEWKDKVSVDDLASLREAEFLNMLEHIGVLTKAEHKELQSCLDRRNTAGHPNSASFEEVTVGAHIYELISKIYSKY
ncbi:hypothetical protein [Bradyrhizobium archetypum]|uniref:DUF4145 domain-containing protein n=1 Tax=Bradyrhizobium archetypum TaxID=2721160 RepID=A0A7Y4HAK8_9BRAD|nr:hypothetical protein [Bradyrhizobium archetypum]NOJ50374.1 hypothetical protein [Bradyrhizobium archetypum]